MKTLVEWLPKDQLTSKPDVEILETPGEVPVVVRHGAEGAELRAFRALLVQLDSTMRFGGLRRVLTPSGDYLWICPRPEHYRIYDPGLPTLP